MDIILFLGYYALVFVGLPIGLGLSFYFIPKKLGYPKTAKYLTIAYGLFVFAIGLFIAFEDQLFTKNSAKELIEEQGFKLIDEFDLVNNESSSGLDYYHTFTLKISDKDKLDVIAKIMTSDNFIPDNSDVENLQHNIQDRYFRQKVIQNYETEKSFVREYFQPSERQGYAPTYRKISISKTENELTFEDIID